jgi:hypothetical protein
LLLHRLQLSTEITGSVARDPEAARPLHRARCCGWQASSVTSAKIPPGSDASRSATQSRAPG